MADKVSGFLNFMRWMFNDEFRVQRENDDVPRQLILPGSGASAYYQNLDTNFGVGSSWLKEYLVVENDLISRYIDYEDMDDYPELSSALDIYADDATQPDGLTGKSVRIDCLDDTMSQLLTDLFDENLRIEEDIWEIARSLCKYGNDFEEIIVKDGEGVVDLNFLPAPTVRRVEDTEGGLLGFIQDYTVNFRVSNDEFLSRISNRQLEHESIVEATIRSGLPVRTFENWELVHFRLRSKHRRAMYGFGMLESVRFLFKRMLLLEDSMLMYRLTRAPERLAFYIDVGNVPPNEALSYIKKVKNEYKKRKWVDPRTGKLDMSFNPLAADEDFFVPVRNDKRSASIERIDGANYQGTEDINYFKEKMYTGVKIPKDYLNYMENTPEGNLSQKDMRFARTILRVQRIMRNGFKHIGRVHLASLGTDPDIVPWEIIMNPPSAVFELAQMEVRNAQLDLASRYKEFASQYYIMREILHMTDEEIVEINDQKKREELDRTNYPSFESKSRVGGLHEKQFPKYFFEGNKESEKFLKSNISHILANDPALNRRFNELKALMLDLKGTVARRER